MEDELESRLDVEVDVLEDKVVGVPVTYTV